MINNNANFFYTYKLTPHTEHQILPIVFNQILYLNQSETGLKINIIIKTLSQILQGSRA